LITLTIQSISIGSSNYPSSSSSSSSSYAAVSTSSTTGAGAGAVAAYLTGSSIAAGVGLSKGPLVYLILFYLDKFFIGLA
jgi:uncharacterized membrane protein YebE (DUF533 family)